VVVAAGAAAAVAAGVGVGVGADAAQVTSRERRQRSQVLQQVDDFLARSAGDGDSSSSVGEGDEDDGDGGDGRSAGTGGIAPTPSNLLPIPVPGSSFRNDGGCGDDSILFADGNCYPVLRRGPCPGRHQWLTVDPTTLKGRCMPRLCAWQRAGFCRTGRTLPRRQRPL